MGKGRAFFLWGGGVSYSPISSFPGVDPKGGMLEFFKVPTTLHMTKCHHEPASHPSPPPSVNGLGYSSNGTAAKAENEESKKPSYRVLLHGSLKCESKVALIQLRCVLVCVCTVCVCVCTVYMWMTFGKRGCCKGELSFPGGIHIRGKFVYVTECGNHRVSVFTTSGALVTSFGSSRELQVPGGISAGTCSFVHIYV